MPELPVLSGREAAALLVRMGFVLLRQKGSHMILRKGSRGCVIPDHRELAQGTLRGALRQAGVSADEFLHTHRNS